MTPTPEHIWALRSELKLSREAFGNLFCVKARTIESWEQLDPQERARRVPRGMALDKLLKLCRKHGVDITTA